MHKQRTWVIGFLAFWLLWTSVLVSIRLRQADLDHGTMLADAAVVSAGRYADEHGLASTRGFPVYETYRVDGTEPWLYVTYPPGRLWLLQAGKAMGLDGFRARR